MPIRTLALGVALAALSVSVLPRAGQAYTAEEQQACQPDAFRLCGSEIPDIDRVTACMVAKKSQLSPECRRFFRPDPEPVAVPPPPAGKPVNIRPATTKPVAAKKPAKPKKTESKTESKTEPKTEAKETETKKPETRKPASKKPAAKKPEKPNAT